MSTGIHIQPTERVDEWPNNTDAGLLSYTKQIVREKGDSIQEAMKHPLFKCNESRWPLLLGTMALLLMMCSLLAISISLQTAYMWLALVLITILFLTTFTCTKQAPLLLIQDSTNETTNTNDENTSFTEVHHRIHRQISQVDPYWVNDLPPPYTISVTMEETAPPPYLAAISHFELPPSYQLSSEQEAKERLQVADRKIQVTNNSALQTVQKNLATASVTIQLSPEQGLQPLTLAATEHQT